ncbi:MAG: TorF family putative porin [Caulobacter sp.]|nr:TorF family putative porin [Caulobacter sp.]
MISLASSRRCGAAAASLCAITAAGAAEAREVDAAWKVKATAASEYMSKGAGKSDGDPALQMEIAYEAGPLDIGVWGSTAAFAEGGDAELQAFVSGDIDAGPIDLDLRAMVKHAPGTVDGVQDTWLELRADGEVKAAGSTLRLRVEYSPDSYGRTEAAWWIELQASRKIAADWKVSAAYGAREQDLGTDYRAWNAGVTWKATERLSLDLRWYDTDNHGGGSKYDGRLFASATVSF